jgi:hypothetical protein
MAVTITLSHNALTNEHTSLPAPTDPAATPAASVAPLPLPPYAAPTTAVRFPLGWLLDHGSAAIRYRAAVEVARLYNDAVPKPVAGLPYLARTALLLAASQGLDGTWGQRMLAVPTDAKEGVEGVGMVLAVRRLLEGGWDRESPPVAHARRLLFRLLAEDNDPNWLFELRGEATDDGLVRHYRQQLREAAAATLAQAGYESDPRLRGAARRILERVGAWLRSPLCAKPWVRIGNRHVLIAEAAPPSLYTLLMLAHMPLFRTEHHDTMHRLYNYLSQPLPRQESVQMIGEHVLPQPLLVLGDPLHSRQALEGDIGFALTWLELVARLGFLRRNEGWSTRFERMLENRDSQGVWRGKGEGQGRSAHPLVWPAFPLQEPLDGEGRHADVTFRLGLIARLSGRPIELT